MNQKNEPAAVENRSRLPLALCSAQIEFSKILASSLTRLWLQKPNETPGVAQSPKLRSSVSLKKGQFE